MDIVVGIAQTVIAVVALYVGWKALRISEDVQRDAARERNRAELHNRLMWLQTLLNAVAGIPDARFADNEETYVDRQRWILTALATAGLRAELPQTGQLAERPFSEPYGPGIIELTKQTRQEIHEALERGYQGAAPAAIGP